MYLNKETTLGDIVAENYKTAAVFENHQMDFCCHGGRSLAEACAEKELSVDTIIEELQTALTAGDTETAETNSAGMPQGIKQWPLDLMADYVEKKHHRFVSEQIPVIEGYLQKIVQVHGTQHPELEKVQNLFKETAGELAMHMKKEELMLFPYIRKMTQASVSGRKIEKPGFGSIANPINAMLADHEAEGERSAGIRNLTGNFQTPADGCNTYQLTLKLLADFEADLHQHIHIENNILFPKSIELEKTIQG